MSDRVIVTGSAVLVPEKTERTRMQRRCMMCCCGERLVVWDRVDRVNTERAIGKGMSLQMRRETGKRMCRDGHVMRVSEMRETMARKNNKRGV